MDRIDEYLKIVPSPMQKKIQKMGFYAFIHFGMNTFTEKEWGEGKVGPEHFNPTALDTDQWARVIAEAGMGGVILTVKHHDGFCLFPSKYTDYTIANSPYKDGKGDIVRELADSCKKFGLKLGIYLSPWDRHEPTYGTPAYNDFYVKQLHEVLTNYGEIFCVWLDGACGAAADGKEKQKYDFERFFETVRALQPGCLISNCGPDIRWVGNEAGIARESEWNVVPKFAVDVQTIEKNSQQEDNEEFRKRGADIVFSDLGSRAFLKDFDEFMWYPAEVDVSIRPGWFYHEHEDKRVRSADNLLSIYLNSVGGNSLLLLNLPPDRRGLIAEPDLAALQEFKKRLDDLFAKPVSITEVKDRAGKNAQNLLNEEESYFATALEDAELTFRFAEAKKVDKMILRENTDFSQRVEKFEIWAELEGRRKKVYDGTVIGFNKIALFKKPVMADALIVKVTECRRNPYLEYAAIFEENGALPKKRRFSGLIRWAHEFNYKMYIKQNKL